MYRRTLAACCALAVALGSGCSLQEEPADHETPAGHNDHAVSTTEHELSAVPEWTATGAREDDYLGRSVSLAGDINADGFDDIVVGAPALDGTLNNPGQVFVHYGSATGLSTDPDATLVSDETDDYFGWAVSSAGDVNGDGFDDIIVGAPEFDSTRGRALVFHGSADGFAASADWTYEGDEIFYEVGNSVSFAGDVNADGFDDVIVGAPYPSSVTTAPGEVLVFFGSANGLSATPDWKVIGSSEGSYFGSAISSAGDVNADGFDDIIVGASRFEDTETKQGKALVYYGSASGPSTSADWTMIGEDSLAQFGRSVSFAGDVNADGFDDVIVGAPKAVYGIDQEGGFSEGAVYVFHGSSSGLSSVADWAADLDVSTAEFGNSVSFAGDVNADGFDDVVVGAHKLGLGDINDNRGKVVVFHGSASGLGDDPQWEVLGDAEEGLFGHDVSAAGDVDGNGRDDVIVGNYAYSVGDDFTFEGRAWVYQSFENRAPVAEDDDVSLEEDSSLSIDVLANDSDADGDTLSVSIEQAPAEGSATVEDDDTITYMPAADFYGSDSFTYRIDDGNGESDTATASIAVTSVNDAPTFIAPTPADQETFAVVEGETLSFTMAGEDIEDDALTYAVTPLPAGAALDATAGSFEWTPTADQAGTHELVLSISDSQLSEERQISVEVTALDNDADGDGVDDADDQCPAEAGDGPDGCPLDSSDTPNESTDDDGGCNTTSAPANGLGAIVALFFLLGFRLRRQVG